jgi:hypothetical protein
MSTACCVAHVHIAHLSYWTLIYQPKRELGQVPCSSPNGRLFTVHPRRTVD